MAKSKPIFGPMQICTMLIKQGIQSIWQFISAI